MARLVAALPATRACEGRLSEDVPYRPFVRPQIVRSRPHAQFGRPDGVQLLRALADVYQERGSDRSPRAKGDIAIAKLYEGEPRLGASILERAARETPDDASLSSDLAVAYLSLSQLSSDGEYVAEALEAAASAVATDGSCAAALFNRALAAQAAGLSTVAREGWAAYLALDPDSEYAVEARSHLARLDASPAPSWRELKRLLHDAAFVGDEAGVRAIVERHPDAAHAYARDDIFGEWADLALAGDPRANEAARGCTLLASVLESVVLDSTYVAAAADLGSPGRDRQSLAIAHRAFRDGRRLLERREVDAARVEFDAAVPRFASANCPAFEAHARSYAAFCDFIAFDYDGALLGLEVVRAIGERHGFRGILGRAAWLRGSILQRRSELVRSSDSYREAIEHYESVRDWDAVAPVRGFLVTNSLRLANHEQFRVQLAYTLGDLSRLASKNRRQRVLSELALTLSQEPTLRVALEFANESFSTPDEDADAELRVSSCMQRGVIRAKLGEVAAAQADLREAERRATELPSVAMRELLRPRLLVASGAIALAVDPASAIAPLNEACELVDRLELRNAVGSEAHVLRARAYEALGQFDQAEEDLDVVIDASQRNSKVLGGAYEPSAYDRPHEAFEAMISLQIERRGRPDLGLQVAEAARAQALLAELRPSGLSRFDVEKLRRMIPASTVLVEYAALRDRTYAWVLGVDGLAWTSIPVGAEAVQAETSALRAAVDSSGTATPPEAARLYDLFVRPLSGKIAGARDLVVVAPSPLTDAPFAMFFDSDRGTHLVEDVAITMVPSAAVYAACVERAAALGERPPASILVVGNPSFDKQEFKGLSDLPGAETEAREIARMYMPGATLLCGTDATESRVLERAKACEILHFAAHGLPNAVAPSLSTLVLAPDASAEVDRRDGGLRASDLASVRLPNTRVVVLAACRSGEIAGTSDDAISAFARSLLVAGVPIVITSTWNVDDNAGVRFSLEFHTALRAGATPAQAVRRAQLELLRSPDPTLRAPKAWAAFGAVGGTAR